MSVLQEVAGLATAESTGTVVRVSGPVVVARGLPAARLFDVVHVGAARLLGEIIRIDRDTCVIQVFEDTTGLAAGEPVTATGAGLQVELGPGLLGSIVDGTQRPLRVLAAGGAEAFIARGADPPKLDRERRWDFQPSVALGDTVDPGQIIGTVPEGPAFQHRVLVPAGVHGTVTELRGGPATVDDVIARVGVHPIRLFHRWPVRRPRPSAGRAPLSQPLVTGQRVLDLLFPVARGGSAVVPGGFGTGKTVLEQSLAKHAAADIVVYVGCGERGNELTEVLEEFPEIVDPRTGASLMQRTVLVANTSNMPVAAREASIYTGITIAEYFRDQGYHVAMMADSTSRWGEALREVSSRLEEIPAEDGYPAYLATRLAGFYERAGLVTCIGPEPRQGSVTLIGAVSPAGGDFSEPMTQTSLRLTGCFWALDTALARQRHFPAINWTRSYTQYDVVGWFDSNVADDWSRLRRWALAVLQQETSLLEVVALLGVEALAAEQRLVLRTGRLLREDVLQQDSFNEVDASCPPAKQIAMLRTVHAADTGLRAALHRGVAVEALETLPELADLAPMKYWPVAEVNDRAAALTARIEQSLESLT